MSCSRTGLDLVPRVYHSTRTQLLPSQHPVNEQKRVPIFLHSLFLAFNFILIKIDYFSGPSTFSVAKCCRIHSLSLTFLLWRKKGGKKRKITHSFCRTCHSNLVSLQKEDAFEYPSCVILHLRDIQISTTCVIKTTCVMKTQLLKNLPIFAPLHQHFLFCHYWNIYSWEVSPPQIIPMGSSLIGHLLPKNMGVLPNSSKLAGCPNDVICKYYFKEEAVQVGHVLRVCTLWKSSMRQYKELHATSWRMPTFSRFCSFFFLRALPFVFRSRFERASTVTA